MFLERVTFQRLVLGARPRTPSCGRVLQEAPSSLPGTSRYAHWAGPRGRWGSARNTLLLEHKYLGPDARPPRAACRLPPAAPAQLQGAWELPAGGGQAQICVLERSLTAVGRRSSLWYFSSCGQSLGRWKHSADLLKASSRIHGV